eukprot:621731-Hanusia_phi.AAC.4
MAAPRGFSFTSFSSEPSRTMLSSTCCSYSITCTPVIIAKSPQSLADVAPGRRVRPAHLTHPSPACTVAASPPQLSQLDAPVRFWNDPRSHREHVRAPRPEA